MRLVIRNVVRVSRARSASKIVLLNFENIYTMMIRNSTTKWKAEANFVDESIKRENHGGLNFLIAHIDRGRWSSFPKANSNTWEKLFHDEDDVKTFSLTFAPKNITTRAYILPHIDYLNIGKTEVIFAFSIFKLRGENFIQNF